MTDRIDEILAHIQKLEHDMAHELEQRRDALVKDFHDKKLRFEHEVLEQQRRFKIGLFRYIWNADLKSILSTPFIYSLIVPFVLLDISISLYQRICFPLYGIKKVQRKDHIVFDRSHLAYLNILEKINCAYCSYVNGLISLTREVAGKTELYWCPIKHAKRLYQAHPYYGGFVEYGDAKAYRTELQQLREKVLEISKKGHSEAK